MLWIGITGPMGSGKSTVASRLRQMGFEVLDADDVARKVLGPGGPCEAEVLKTFGGELRGPDGHLDRRALGRVVFADKKKLRQLEAIVHPRVRDEVADLRRKLALTGVPAAFYDVPLLFEKNMREQFDHVLVIRAGEALRRKRLKKRSHLTDEEIDERNLRHLAPEIKEAAASAVIRNEGSLEALRVSIEQALKKLKIPLPTAADSEGRD